jgi:hypothetical protein
MASRLVHIYKKLSNGQIEEGCASHPDFSSSIRGFYPQVYRGDGKAFKGSEGQVVQFKL